MTVALCLHWIVFHQTSSPFSFARAEQALRVTLFRHWMPSVQSPALQGRPCLLDHSDLHTFCSNTLGR